MEANEESPPRVKARRRGTEKMPRRESIKKSICLSPEAADRLGIHAVKMRRGESAIVEELILAHLRRFVVSDRGGPSLEISAIPADEVRDSAPILALGEAVTPAGGENQAEGPGQGRGQAAGRRKLA